MAQKAKIRNEPNFGYNSIKINHLYRLPRTHFLPIISIHSGFGRKVEGAGASQVFWKTDEVEGPLATVLPPSFPHPTLW